MIILNRALLAMVIFTCLGFVVGTSGSEFIYRACTSDSACESILVSFGGN